MQLPGDIAMREVPIDRMDPGAWAAWLSEAEQARAAGIRHAQRRAAFVAGRMAARGLLADRLHVAPPDVPLRVAEDGAVEAGRTGWHVSIAHSGARAVAVAARRPVGVDIEVITPRRPGVQRFLLHPDEYAAFEALSCDPTRALILYWTLKEATLKGLRTGLRLSPKKLRLSIDEAAGSASVWVEQGEPWEARYEERDGYFVAVAYR